MYDFKCLITVWPCSCDDNVVFFTLNVVNLFNCIGCYQFFRCAVTAIVLCFTYVLQFVLTGKTFRIALGVSCEYRIV